ncbi:MAG: substrate-binding domain-containing protein, partial [candidate division KSB1 bacterium]|nr:substrate-binding domain-containing protein [candidate division KSB1 bacterium]
SIVLLPASTREAIVHLLNDSVRIIITDRALNAEEKEVAEKAGMKITETKIAEDALAVVVHNQNPVENLSLKSLKQIVSRELTDWRQVPEAREAQPKWSGPVEFAFTGRNSGAYELLADKFLNLKEEIVPTFLAASQREVADYVANHPRALGIVSAACFYEVVKPSGVPDTTTVLRALAIERADTTAAGVFAKLHQANIYLGAYPLHYSVYIFSTSPGYTLATGFSAFVASYNGQKIILDAGLVPATMPIRLVQVK